MTTSLDDIVANFELLDEWDDRYRYLIELGKSLEPLPEEDHIDVNKVRGCASQVWLVTEPQADGTLRFRGDSDAHIVSGLVAIMLRLYSGRAPADIVAFDAKAALDRLGLSEALSSQRSNGLKSMVARIQRDAQAALGKPALG